MKKLYPDLRVSGRNEKDRRRTGAFHSRGRENDSFFSFYRNLREKIAPMCTEDIACAYWVYLYKQNSRAPRY